MCAYTLCGVVVCAVFVFDRQLQCVREGVRVQVHVREHAFARACVPRVRLCDSVGAKLLRGRPCGMWHARTVYGSHTSRKYSHCTVMSNSKHTPTTPQLSTHCTVCWGNFATSNMTSFFGPLAWSKSVPPPHPPPPSNWRPHRLRCPIRYTSLDISRSFYRLYTLLSLLTCTTFDIRACW